MLKAYTGLEGGLVASGSTCGVVTGGAAGIALMHLDALSQAGAVAEFRILPLVQDYMHWFEKHYGSCLCRYRTGVDFHTPAGQTRYFLPGDKTAGCLLHIRGAVRYISELRNRPLPDSDQTAGADLGRATHCAATVLEKIAERTGLSDDTLSRIAFVLRGFDRRHPGDQPEAWHGYPEYGISQDDTGFHCRPSQPAARKAAGQGGTLFRGQYRRAAVQGRCREHRMRRHYR